MHYIYKITNLINQKIYIGQTTNPSGRWSKHKSAARHKYGSQLITRSMSKFGVDNFIFEVIATCLTLEDANESETIIIAQYDSCNLAVGYNIDRGGKVFPPKPEISSKISTSLKKYYTSNSSPMKGKSLPESWKINISKASLGKPGTNLGKKFSPEWCAKLSKSNVNRSREHKRKFTEEIELEICRRYCQENLSIYKLAKEYKVYGSLIISILNRHNIDRRKSNYTKNVYRRTRFSKEQELEICKIYLNGGVSRASIGRQFGCKPNVITAILTRNKVLGDHNEKEKE